MVTIRRRWPDPRTGEVIDLSEDIGPGQVIGSQSLNGNNVGRMDAGERNRNLAGVSTLNHNAAATASGEQVKMGIVVRKKKGE